MAGNRDDAKYGGGAHGNRGYFEGYESQPGMWGSRPEPGGFAGRGPKNYTRSDESILDEVCRRLTDDDRVDASEIEVRVQNGEVTLVGEVDTRQTKRLAEDVVDTVRGVRDVHNQLKARNAQPLFLDNRPETSDWRMATNPRPKDL